MHNVIFLIISSFNSTKQTIATNYNFENGMSVNRSNYYKKNLKYHCNMIMIFLF